MVNIQERRCHAIANLGGSPAAQALHKRMLLKGHKSVSRIGQFLYIVKKMLLTQ
jgi:hypothetical protein